MNKELENQSKSNQIQDANPDFAAVTVNGRAVFFDKSIYRYTGQSGFYVNPEGKAIEVKRVNLYRGVYLPYRRAGEKNTRKIAQTLFPNQQGRDDNATEQDRFN